MKITDVTTHLLTARWIDDPSFPQTLYSTALIHIETDTEIDGWGEATLGYFVPETVPPFVEFFKPTLVGRDPLQLSKLHFDLLAESVWWARNGAGRSIVSGIELALWDIMGKALNVPVHQLLGGAVRERVPVYASGGPTLWPMEDNIRKIEHYVNRNYRAAKLSSHFYESAPVSETSGGRRLTIVDIPFAKQIEKVAENFALLRSEFGDDFDLAIDGHQGAEPNPITVTEAMQLCDALAPYRLQFYEEPLAFTDVDGYAQLCAHSRIPIGGGESFAGLDQFHTLLSRNGLHVIQPDVGFVGGIQETLRIIHHAEATNVKTVIHTGASFGPSMAASWHVAAAVSSVTWLETVVAAASVHDDLLVEPFQVKDGTIGLPTAPGLGVRISDELLNKYRFVPGSGERS